MLKGTWLCQRQVSLPNTALQETAGAASRPEPEVSAISCALANKAKVEIKPASVESRMDSAFFNETPICRHSFLMQRQG